MEDNTSPDKNYERRETKVKKIIKNNPWLVKMWEEGEKATLAYWYEISRIEKRYQKKYNKSKNDVFFAVLEGELIGIDWKNCRTNKNGHFIYDRKLR